jgi:DNA-binding NarL/FixJ family response regulator
MRVVVVDDDPLITMALKTILSADPQVEVCACGSSGAEGIDLYRKEKPDVLLMDIRMKDTDGLEASEQILREYPDARILLLTTFLDDEYIIRAIRTGARGYLLKQDYGSLLPALKAVCTGQTVFGSEITAKMPDLLQQGHFPYESLGLSQKEYQLICLVAEGLSNREIAQKAYLSEGTVRNYLSTILEKLGLRDRTQLAVFYYKNLRH